MNREDMNFLQKIGRLEQPKDIEIQIANFMNETTDLNIKEFIAQDHMVYKTNPIIANEILSHILSINLLYSCDNIDESLNRLNEVIKRTQEKIQHIDKKLSKR